ncbi:MAG: hypothetical protein H6672_08925 [Anaerolineaceae bacterium]|nr:hypothetical protein [Anaerolineaceae bacterium]
MPEKTRAARLGSLISNIDNNHSPVYILAALLFYFVPVILISFLLVDRALNQEYFIDVIGLFLIVIVFFPLMLTFGVFMVYRATYSTRTYIDMNSSSMTLTEQQRREEQQWNYVINKALDWRRYLMSLCLLNMFITIIGGYLLVSDIVSSDGLYFGVSTVPLVYMTTVEGDINASNTVGIPGSVLWLGMAGYLFQYLESTRRRFVSRNLVPRFYLMSAFRLLQVMLAVVVGFLAINIIIPNPPADLVLLTAFVIGLFPMQILAPVVGEVRQRLGMQVTTQLPITMINGIDSTLESLLQEENIDSVQLLATTNVDIIHKRTRIPVRALLNWQRQARLFNVLGTQTLIDRFARIGINDFDDLGVLAAAIGSLPDDPEKREAFQNDFTSAMLIKSDEESMGTDAFWRVLIQVLIREYQAEFLETPAKLLDEDTESQAEILVSIP